MDTIGTPTPAPRGRRTRRKPGLERLLAATDEVLYTEGAGTGVQRILDLSGVARGTLYANFEGKDELVEAYLERRHHETLAAFEVALEPVDRDDPAAVFDAVLDVAEGRSLAGGFRGCAFVVAVAELPAPDGAATSWARRHKHAVKEVLARPLAGRVADVDAVAEALVVLYDGALLSSALRPGEGSFAAARRTGALVLAAALA